METNTTYQVLLENLFDGVYYVDKDQKITFWNAAAEKITGFQKVEVLGSSCADNILCHIDTLGREICKHGCPLHETLKDGQSREASVFLHHKLGHRVSVHIRVAPIRNEDDEIIGAVEVFSDNTRTIEMLQHLEEVKTENLLDPLLRIGNRRFAEKIFETRLYELKAFDTPFSVIMVDIDNFKQVNEKHGHNNGDKVLHMVTRSLLNTIRDLDDIIRWGGDEFVVIVPNLTSSNLINFTERIRLFIEKSFLMIEDEIVSVVASMGATSVKAEDTLETVIDRVDTQLYASKRKGGNCITIG